MGAEMGAEYSPQKGGGDHSHDDGRDIKLKVIAERPSQESCEGIDEDKKTRRGRRLFVIGPSHEEEEGGEVNPASNPHESGKKS